MSTAGPNFQSFDSEDQRYLPRWITKNRVIYQMHQDTDSFETITHDLSCAGACIEVKNFIPKNEKISMKMYLTDSVSVDMNGLIVWNKLSSDTILAGIQFYNTSEETQTLIFDHSFEINKDQVIKNWFKGWDGS